MGRTWWFTVIWRQSFEERCWKGTGKGNSAGTWWWLCFLSCRISCRQWNGWRVNERSADTIGVVDEVRVLGDHITMIVGNSLGPHLGFTGELHIIYSKVFNAHCTEFHLASWLYVFCKVSLTFCGPGCQAGAEDMVGSSILHKLVHVSCTTSTLLSCKYCSNHDAGVWVAVRGI